MIDEVEAIVTVQPQFNEIVIAVPGPAGEGVPGGGLTLEQCMDAIAAMLVAGANVTLDYVDGSDTLTISAADGGLTTEQIQDMLSTFLVSGANISIGYNDVGNQLTIAVTGLGGAAGLDVGSIAGTVAAGDHTHAGGTLTVQDENSNVATSVTQIDFQGAGVTTTTGTGEVVVTIAGGGPGGSVEVQDEGVSLSTAATLLNFTGYGVQVTEPSSDQISVVIPGIAPRKSGVSGAFYWPTMTGDTVSFGVYQRLYFIPFVGNGATVVQALVQVDTGGAGGVVRLGLYDDGSSGQLSLIEDFGVAPAVSPGFNTTPAISRVLTLGTVYTIAVCIQGNSAVKVRGGSMVAPVQSRLSSFGSPNPTAVYYQDAVVGALPAFSFAPYGGTVTSQCPWVQVYLS